ncbi:response regulator transcription factor [Aequorivita sp. KMM 9714]|uniref:response regulator transcription factor n=1 Tax=Aequorivita sp. KMM 9714 TaxID=2707173 RepID=UPI0013EDB30F|nr:response regulator transcription factor [Aequorivita sp. KMM 9714]NGX85059.1 response regulator transcription factor [Aequorivita sp. KMM 9714]
MSKTQVLIVEDNPLIAEDIRDALTSVDFTVVGVAHNKNDAIQLLEKTNPDIALLDINLGGNLDGICIAETINTSFQIPFLFLTSYSNKEILDKVKHTLPMGYIVKPFDEADLFTTIEIAISNFYRINKTHILHIDLINNEAPNPLTQKEFEILKDIYFGSTNSQISESHHISVNTVKTHIKNIYEKLDIHSRTEAIVKIRTLLQK